ncbi:MAG: hypothetical protein IJX94_00175 [Clostridia bacterium]|nr:hypothetical protein [Clostridia bacterium]
MMKKRGFLTLTSLYAVIMLCILIASVTVLTTAFRKRTVSQPPSETEYIYVSVTQEQTQTQVSTEDTAPSEDGWIVKEHGDRIGIFSRDGVLLFVLDTYIKTLPEADRRLLREGIVIESQGELLALIEDYTA